VRTIVALALVLVACGPADRPDPAAGRDAPSASSSSGPDAIVLRIPRNGGSVRAYRYPDLDSLIWTSASPAAPPARVLAFDPEAGSVAYVDRKGVPGRIDLRAGTVGVATRAKLTSLSSADGWAIYGIAANGNVTRLTPTGDWSYEPPEPARLVLPQDDGSLLVLTDQGSELGVLRIRPPDSGVTDSAAVPDAERIVHAQAGDRIYFGIDSSLLALRGRSLEATPELHLDNGVTDVAPTPSGDRLFVLTDSSRQVSIIDRYRDQIARTIALPGPASALRMDPLGRYVLARAESGDSAWIVAVGTAQVIGSVGTPWREDLPFVAPDGALAIADGDDLRIVDAETQRERSVVEGGARDFWHVIVWNGFRPRSGELDQPVTFADSDSVDLALPDSAAAPVAPNDSQPPPPRPPTISSPGQAATRPPRAPIPRPAPPRLPADTAAANAPRSRGWIVSFATFVSEAPARSRAARIRVDGQSARVVASQTAGTTVYRVVLGPYPTKADAERVGRESGESYWVYEGNP
jgi:cell division septation protein DedD